MIKNDPLNSSTQDVGEDGKYEYLIIPDGYYNKQFKDIIIVCI